MFDAREKKGSLIGADLNAIQELLSKGADVNSMNSAGLTPLFQAVGMGHKDIVNYLIERVANIYHKAKNGKTALDMANDFGESEIAGILRSWGAR